MNVNPKRERKHKTRTKKVLRLSQDIREPMEHHDMSQHVTDMSHQTYYHAG